MPHKAEAAVFVVLYTVLDKATFTLSLSCINIIIENSF
jgi:hypothetical protein